MKSVLKVSSLALLLGFASLNIQADGHGHEVDESLITTPDEAIAALKAGNERFMKGNTLKQDFHAQIEATSTGQQPYATVLSCLDSRIPPEIVFDQGIGDIFVGRVAGNVADTGMLGSFEFATELVGTKVIVVMGHTSCGAIKGACAGAELGNLTELLAGLKPAVETVASANPDKNVCEAPLVDTISRQNVEDTIAEIRADSPVISKLEAEGKVKVVGAMYDITTGEVTFL
jgi:carbonic anhydrase